MLQWKKRSSIHLVSFAPRSAREWAHRRASHWSGWIGGDSSSVLWPSEEDPLTNPGSPSNRIDNSGAAAPTSLPTNLQFKHGPRWWRGMFETLWFVFIWNLTEFGYTGGSRVQLFKEFKLLFYRYNFFLSLLSADTSTSKVQTWVQHHEMGFVSDIIIKLVFWLNYYK